MKLTTVPLESSTRPASRAHWIAQTAGYFGTFIVLGLVASILGPTLPALAERLQTSTQGISLLFSVRSFGYLLGSLQSGVLYDRLRGHPILASATIVIALLMALVPFTGVLAVMIAIFLLVGIAEGMIDVGGNTLLVWAHHGEVGPYMNGLHFCFGAGAFLAPLIVAQLVTFDSPSLWSYWILAALAAPLGLALFWVPSPVVAHSATAATAEPTRYGLAALVALFFLLYVGAEVSFGGWVFSYADALQLTDSASAAYLTSAFWGALTLGRLVAIPLTARLRPRTILLGDLVGCLLSVGAILLLPHSLAALWLGTAGLGLAMASIFPTTLAFAARRMPVTGKVTSVFLVGASLGAMLVPWLIGQLFGPAGPRIAMVVVLIVMLLACVVFGLLMRLGGSPAAEHEH
jgi:FHS family Na+ dependent glucose MFS transporter 1